MAIAPEIQERLLESLARFEIEAFERARAYAGPRSPDAAALELRREEALQKVLPAGPRDNGEFEYRCAECGCTQ